MSVDTPGVTLGNADAAVLLFARECGSEGFRLPVSLCEWLTIEEKKKNYNKTELVPQQHGTENGTEDCSGGIRHIRRSCGAQTGQSRVSSSSDTGVNWQERWQDINKQTGWAEGFVNVLFSHTALEVKTKSHLKWRGVTIGRMFFIVSQSD